MMLKLTDPEGFAAAYRQHERSVYGAALRVLGDPNRAEDVVQDVFLRLWRRPEAFDPARGELGSFLRLMARSRALDLWRENDAASRARDRLEVAAVASEPLRRDDGPAASLEREEDRTVIRAAVAELPEAQREAVALAYWGDLTAQEISRRVSVPLGTAKSRLRLGLGKLRTECAGTV